MKINKLIIIFLLFSFENFKHLSAKELDSHYEEYLEQADKYLSTYKFCNSKEKNEKMENDCSETISASYLKLTKEKLEKLETEYPAPDYRFFGLRGMLYEELGKIDLATEDYEKALSLKPNEKNIAKRLFEIYGEDRRPQKAFNFARIYLSQDPENKLIRYRALILASRLGERKYFNFSLSKIEASKKSNSLETILKEVDKLISKKDFKQCKNILDESILLYPTSLKLHNQSIQVERKINSSKNEMEKLLLDKAAIFYTEKKYSLELAMFYKENNRKYEALNLYRRMFHQAIKKQGYNFEEEILYLLRDSYISLGWEKEANAISDLISASRTLDHSNNNELQNLYIISESREILEFLLFHLKEINKIAEYNKYKQILIERDLKYADREFMNIFPVFEKEND